MLASIAKRSFINLTRTSQQMLRGIRDSIASRLSGGIASTHDYENYDEYVLHQKDKTTNPERVDRLLGEEWEMHLNRFRETFRRNNEYINDKKNALCLGSRTGQEVKVLRDMGVHAVGIDLVPFEPYTLVGDIHDLNYNDEKFDLVFTNIFDHSLYPEKFCSEMERVIAPGGVIIMHLQLGANVDDYAETIIYDHHKVEAMFQVVEVIESRHIRIVNDPMNWELVLVKKPTVNIPATTY